MMLLEVQPHVGKKIRIVQDLGAINHPPAHRDFLAGEVLTFVHIDGMYSLCYDSDGNPVHLMAMTEIEVVE
jgi:hypothetical protein